MKQTLQKTLFSAIILIFCFFVAHIILASKTNDVTFGSQIDVSIDDVNIDGVVSFEKKPKAYIEEIKNGKIRMRKLQIVNKGSEFKKGKVTNITCEVRAKVPLSPPGYPVYIIPKAKGIKYDAVMISNVLNLVPPEILTPNLMGEANENLTITGKYFGVKKPKIWISFLEGNKEKKLKCKIVDNFVYLDGKGKTKSCMNLQTGESECQFVVHKKLPVGQVGMIHLANKIGETAVSFNVPGPKLTLVANPTDGGTTIPTLGTHTVASNEIISLSAIPSEHYYFKSWHSSDLALIGNPLEQYTTITILGDTTITAEFLYVEVTNAILEITTFPEGRGTIDPPVGTYQIPTNTPLVLKAISFPGFHFERWYPSTTALVGDPLSSTTTVTVTGNGTLNAFFQTNEAYQVTLTMGIEGEGEVTPLPGNHTLRTGWTYDISAIPEDGYSFFQWSSSGEVEIANSALPNTRVVLSNNAIVTAHFITTTPSNATMRLNAMGPGTTIPSPGAYFFEQNELHQIVAVPQSNAHFIQWTAESGAILDSPNSSTSSVSLTDDASVIAYFANNTNAIVQCFMNSQPPEGGTTIPATGTNDIYLNEIFEIEAVPTNGYHFTGWLVTGNVDIANVLLAKTTALPSDNCGLTAMFEPLPTNITFAGVQLTYASGTNSAQLAWGEAVDDTTPPSSMKYLVYGATTNDRSIIYQPANLLTTLTGQVSADILGLNPNTHYWFLVVPENMQGEKSVNQELTSILTMSNAMELVSSVKVLTDIVSSPIRGGNDICYFAGYYCDYFKTGDLVYVSIDEEGSEIRRITDIYYSPWSRSTILHSEVLGLNEVISEGNLNTEGVMTGLKELPTQNTNVVMKMKMHPAASARYASLIKERIPVYAHPEGKFMIWEVGGQKSENAEYEHTVNFGQSLSYDYSLTFEPSLNSETRWTSRWGPDRFDYAKVEIGGAFILEMQANYSISGNVSLSASQSGILTKTIALTYAVGGVPVYQEIELSLDASCNVHANAIFGATAKAKFQKNISIGMEWDRITGWNPLVKEGADSQFDLIFTNNVNFAAYFSIYPKITTKFYKSASLSMSLQPKFCLSADATLAPNLRDYYFHHFDIYLRGLVDIGADFTMFSKTLASHNVSFIPFIDDYYFYTQPHIKLVSPTQEDVVDIDDGAVTVVVDISNGVNNIVEMNSDVIDWKFYWPVNSETVAPDGRSIDIKWPAGVDGHEGRIGYYVKAVGNGFLGKYGTMYKDAYLNVKDFSPMVVIADSNLKAALREKMSFPYNDFISEYKMMWLPETLQFNNKNISSVSGMGYADRVRKLELNNNSVSDFSPLAGMTALEKLYASNNGIDSCDSFSGLGIKELTLTGNNISSVAPFFGMSPLYLLDVRSNPLTIHTKTNDIPILNSQGITVLYDN